MDRVGRILLAVLLISASACTVEGKITKYWAQFYETRTATTSTFVFRPPAGEPLKNKGWGWVKHNDAVLSAGPGGFVLGSVGGLTWFHSTDLVEHVETFTFTTNLSDVIFKGSSLNLRGVWRRTADGTENLDNQELAIVGGQGGLRGATGSVTYQKVQSKPTTMYWVTCHIYVEDYNTRVDLDSLYKSTTERVHDSAETTNDVLEQVCGCP